MYHKQGAATYTLMVLSYLDIVIKLTLKKPLLLFPSPSGKSSRLVFFFPNNYDSISNTSALVFMLLCVDRLQIKQKRKGVQEQRTGKSKATAEVKITLNSYATVK